MRKPESTPRPHLQNWDVGFIPTRAGGRGRVEEGGMISTTENRLPILSAGVRRSRDHTGTQTDVAAVVVP